ncbi:MAG: M50 family metallopeptidase [Erythrobacter sp.]|uniref:M50 family metallopeptidase n=1 Tax=Erythrobacter sp. TaxID=1042 RepID=UPI00260FB84B|nr:M50 family metallopeptidase [Erythrobacter sp.]MDJ0978238.1 M50 family metallopeptidase [Erythrobacter sp.]
MEPLVQPGSQAEQVGRLILAAIVVLALPAFPFGNYVIYPFMILTTWFHEMGHGMTALLLGQDFERLHILADGSGVALSRVSADLSPFARAAIAAGGPLAPCALGSLMILASAHERLWRPALWAMSAAIFASVIVYVRSPVGFFVLPLVGAALALIAWRAPGNAARFTLQFLGVLGAMSMLRDFDYLFSEQAVIGGKRMLSDTGQMEAALWLPHWVWGAALLVICAVMVGGSLKYALAEGRARLRRKKPPANVVQFRRRK